MVSSFFAQSELPSGFIGAGVEFMALNCAPEGSFAHSQRGCRHLLIPVAGGERANQQVALKVENRFIVVGNIFDGERAPLANRNIACWPIANCCYSRRR